MSLEPGGRSDKYGNQYENFFLAKLLLRLSNEEITSVIVEPLGGNSDSVEFIVECKDKSKKFYQCKLSNTNHSAWSISDLKKHDVFVRAKAIVTNETNNYYYFISPLQYNELDELCKRTRTNSSPSDFINYQLNNSKIKKIFVDCVKEYNLDINNLDDVEQLIFILSHCHFEQCAYGDEAKQDLESLIGMTFTGKAYSVRLLLEGFANDTGFYGKKITANNVIDYLEEHDVHARNYRRDKTILNRISILNKLYWDEFCPINEEIFHRSETEQITDDIQKGKSVILHGKAGTGKSGCIQEIISYLEENHIIYLAVKLDKQPPSVSADYFGNQLGLPESPVYCLSTLAAGKRCVLILDQLDALRWTSSHSSNALSVCKELIAQAETVNKNSNGQLSIIFASRTFDLENDAGLNNLFISKKNFSSLLWSKINVNLFSAEDVIKIIGDCYNSFSSRLKKLLLVPSSLYVWSKLQDNKQKNSISSVHELMDAWWQQIQKKCDLAGLALSDVSDCKNKIVKHMEKNSVFVLPKTLFADRQKEIGAFVSNGLLNENSNNISFIHQSFLDYFIVSAIINDIYSGKDIENLLGTMDEQTPMVRYRLLTVLQNIIDSDRTMFIKQSNILLNSTNVRYYFKCTVFEVIGQLDEPDQDIYTLIRTYINNPEWTDYIFRVVFYGHPKYVTKLKNFSQDEWIADIPISLLSSVSHKVPDFVAEVLRPFAFHDPDQDYKIYRALHPNINNDSNKMFRFRLELLNKNPKFVNDLWAFPELIKEKSLRIIELFDLILKKISSQKIKHIYIGKDEDILKYVQNNYAKIIDMLFPTICDITHDYLPKWSHGILNYEYRDWNMYNYSKSSAREIVEIVKTAFEIYAYSKPDDLIDLIFNLEYPISAVGHEMIMHSIFSLSIDYSDQALEWLLADFENRIFVFSFYETDYLYYAKQIVSKFSPTCSEALFSKLEQKICYWKEPTEWMIDRYKDRLNARKNNYSAYYAYWGFFQKSLLPSMCCSRLSNYSKRLIDVLNRNIWIQIPFYHSGVISGMAKSVVSPIEKNSERISDKTWLQIISTPQEKMNNHWRGDDECSAYVETTHPAFASTLGKQAKIQPYRFASLSLSFPKECYSGYVTNVLFALADSDSITEFDMGLATQVILHYGQSNDYHIVIAILRVIEKHASEKWSNDVLNLVAEIVLNHTYPSENKQAVTYNSDTEHKSSDSLRINSYNCVHGCVLYAIAKLIWEHSELGEYFKKIILKLSNDSNAAVRFAATSCALAYYNIDKTFSVDIYKRLTSADLRVIASYDYWQILSREYHNHTEYFKTVLIQACSSEIDDLAKEAAGMLCAVAIFFDDISVFDLIFNFSFSDNQCEEICRQAVSSFNTDEYHEESKIILLHMIDNYQNELFPLNQLFFNKYVSIQRDIDFLIHLMESPQRTYLLSNFLNYLYESDEDICNYTSVLSAIVNNLSKTGEIFNAEELVKCTVRLYDRGKSNPLIKSTCLDIWDKLFKSNVQDIKPLSDMIDNFE